MPETAFGTNDPRTQKHWSGAMFKYALENSFLTTAGYMGTNAEAIVHVDKKLVEKTGDQVTFELETPLRGTGGGDDDQMVGNSEAMKILNFPLTCHERLHSVQSAGPMSEKRTRTRFRESAKRLLGSWTAEILENDAVAALSGLYNVSTAIETINEKAPSSGRIYYGGQTTAGLVSTATMTTDALLTAETVASTLFGTKIISIVKRMAQAATPKIKPIMWRGKRYYRMLIDVLQAKALRLEAAWNEAQQAANVRGLDNPIFSGAIGVWDGVIIEEYDRIHRRLGAGGTLPSEGFTLNAGRTATSDACASDRSVACALFLGQQAAVLGWGRMPSWKEDPTDANRKPTIGTDMIYGMSKTQFREYDIGADSNTAQADFGVIVVHTHVVVD